MAEIIALVDGNGQETLHIVHMVTLPPERRSSLRVTVLVAVPYIISSQPI